MSARGGPNAIVVFVDGASEVVIGHLKDVGADLCVVDALARLQLEAARLGCAVRLRNPCPELRELLELVGLADVIIAPTDARDP